MPLFVVATFAMHQRVRYLREQTTGKAILDLLLEGRAKAETLVQLVTDNGASLDEYLTDKKGVDHLMKRISKGITGPICKRGLDLKPPDNKARVGE